MLQFIAPGKLSGAYLHVCLDRGTLSRVAVAPVGKAPGGLEEPGSLEELAGTQACFSLGLVSRQPQH